MSGCNVTINRGDKGIKYITVLGTDDHEVARELALERMGWTQAACVSVTVNPKSDDDPNHPTTIEVPVVHEPIPANLSDGTAESAQAAEATAETTLEDHKMAALGEVNDELLKDSPSEILDFSASDSEDDSEG